MIFLRSISEIAGNFDAFIVDLWGVVHDGQKLYPGVRETLQKLRTQNKEIIFLSNAPRRAWRVIEVLDQMQIMPQYYNQVITSGEVAFEHLSKNPIGKSYYSIGPERDAGLLDGSSYRRVKTPKDADFAIVTGFDDDSSVLDENLPELKDCYKAGLPFICTNPDMEIVRQNGTRALCAGVMAEAYEKMGGKVIYFGKPYPTVYDRCFEVFKTKDKAKIAAIGDNLETDIKGANAAGIYSIFITGGVMAKEAATSGMETIFKKHRVTPAAVIEAFK